MIPTPQLLANVLRDRYAGRGVRLSVTQSPVTLTWQVWCECQEHPIAILPHGILMTWDPYAVQRQMDQHMRDHHPLAEDTAYWTGCGLDLLQSTL